MDRNDPSLGIHLRQLLPHSATIVGEMYSADSLPGSPDGHLVKLDIPRISPRQGAELHRLISSASAKTSLEVGLAYGFSTAWIMDALARTQGTTHVAIDPNQSTKWGGVGVETARRLNTDVGFTWIEERSDFALATLAKQGKVFDFIYVDGAHRFDDVVVDFYLSDQILALGGLMVFDDLWMPSIRSVISFIERNRAYERLPSKVGNIAVFRKQQNDTRDWQHFVSFDGSARRRSLLRRVLERLQWLFRQDRFPS